ncbi:CU044_2847 family protein [Streptomyces sp. ST1015]|uniref:CU044_2847 family protein n=1 Tax=Streptomyces sp. ST1015 TaxID=1848900 RepID=UPI0021F08FE2
MSQETERTGQDVTRVARVALPDGTPVWARISGTGELRAPAAPPGRLSYSDTGFTERVEAGVESLHSLITGVAHSLAGPLRAVRPDEASIEFGIELTAKAGKVVGLLADGEAKAAITVTLTWGTGGPPDPATPATAPPATPSGNCPDGGTPPGNSPDGGTPPGNDTPPPPPGTPRPTPRDTTSPPTDGSQVGAPRARAGGAAAGATGEQAEGLPQERAGDRASVLAAGACSGPESGGATGAVPPRGVSSARRHAGVRGRAEGGIRRDPPAGRGRGGVALEVVRGGGARREGMPGAHVASRAEPHPRGALTRSGPPLSAVASVAPGAAGHAVSVSSERLPSGPAPTDGPVVPLPPTTEAPSPPSAPHPVPASPPSLPVTPARVPAPPPSPRAARLPKPVVPLPPTTVAPPRRAPRIPCPPHRPPLPVTPARVPAPPPSPQAVPSPQPVPPARTMPPSAPLSPPEGVAPTGASGHGGGGGGGRRGWM